MITLGKEKSIFILTIGFAIVGGVISGFIVRIGSMNFKDDNSYFQDSVEWNFADETYEQKKIEDNEHDN